MINIYNESQLHRTLKYLYSSKYDRYEVPLEGYICDIYTEQEGIIEIQTEHIAALKPKLTALLPCYPVRIIYPIIENNYILTLHADGTYKSFRKSPKHGSCFQLFKEFLGLIPLLESPKLTVQVLYIDCQTIKIDDKNERSRWKNPRIIEKILLKMNKETVMKGSVSLSDMIYDRIPAIFTSKDLKQLKTGKYTSYIIAFLKKTKKIIPVGKAGRYIQYKKTDA